MSWNKVISLNKQWVFFLILNASVLNVTTGYKSWPKMYQIDATLKSPILSCKKRWLYSKRSATILDGHHTMVTCGWICFPSFPMICIHLSTMDVTVCSELLGTGCSLNFHEYSLVLYSPLWLIHCLLWQQFEFGSGCKRLHLKPVSYGGAHLCVLCFSLGQGGAPV